MSSPTPPAGPTAPEQDWPADVAARIETAVAAVRAKATVPAILAAEGVVYGAILAVLGSAMLILFVIAMVRLVIVYLPIDPLGRRVWITEAGAAAILLGLGMFLWRKRRPKSA